jgi:chemotaxis protein MotB
VSNGVGGGGPGAPLWIISFADMISNLVIFFIVVATFASKSTETNSVPKKVLHGDLGVWGSQKERPDPAMVARRGLKSQNEVAPEAASRRQGHEAEDLRALIQDKQYKVRPNVAMLDDGLRITFEETGTFATGADELSTDGRELVAEIGRFFRGEDVEFVVETHTDDRSFRFSGHASEVELTRAMAVSVAGVLVAEAGIDPPRVGISPFGAERPVEPNSTAAGRARNRRVEIIARERP